MKTRLVSSVMAAVAAMLVWEAQAMEPRKISDEQTVYCMGAGRTNGEINWNGVAPSGPYANLAPIIDMGANSTLVVTNGHSVWAGFIVTNGLATIVIEDGAQPTFARHVIVRGTGELIISNVTSATFGNNGSSPQFLSGGNHHYFDTRRLRFMKDGAFVAGTVTYQHARILNVPDNDDAEHGYMSTFACATSSDPLVWLDGTSEAFVTRVLAAMNSGNLGPRYSVQYPEILPAGQSVLVPAGRTLVIEPIAPYDTSVQNLVDHHAQFGTTSTNTFACGADIELRYATSVLSNHYCKGYLRMDGAFIGVGKVTMPIDQDGTAPTRARQIHYSGDMSGFTGSFDAHYCGASTVRTQPLVNVIFSNDVANASITLGDACALEMGADATRAVGTLTGENARTSWLKVADGQTISVSSVSGGLNIVGAGAGVSTVDFASVTPYTVLSRSTTATVTFNGSAARPLGTASATSADGTETFDVYPETVGETHVADAHAALQAVGLPHDALDVADGVTLKGTVPSVVVRTGSGARVTVDAEAGDATATVTGAGTFALAEPALPDPEAWTNKVDYWFDFSRLDCMRYISSDADEPDESMYTKTMEWVSPADKTLKRNVPVFERWMDWRDTSRVATLWNSFYYKVAKSTAPNYCPAVATNCYPHNANLSYLYFGTSGNRRLPFATTRDGGRDGNPIAVKYVVMVYGSELGGGMALVASSDEAFLRDNGKDKPFLKDTSLASDIVIRTNGVEVVDPFTATPNGDWQIVTIQMNAHTFKGLGFSKEKNYNNANYQYGEVLLVTEDVSTVELQKMEKYLADKWNLPYSPTAAAEIAAYDAKTRADAIASQTNVVTGVGAATVVGGTHTLRLNGNFAGTLELAGGKLLVGEEALPYTEAQVAAVGNREFWIDAEDAASLRLVGTDYGHDAISVISNKTLVAQPDDKCAFGVAARQPYLCRAAHGLGVERNWIDFYEYSLASGKGNFLRWGKAKSTINWDSPELSSIDEAAGKMTIRTVLMAVDSTYGGGNPLFDNNLNASGTIGKRSSSYTGAIWPGTNIFSADDSETRLNGATVDQADGFTGKAEVLASRGATALNDKWYVSSYQTGASPTTDKQRVILGEALYFSTTLADADVKGIEAYLMGKWLGYLPSGFADVRQATITGSGEIEVADAAKMPCVASDFAGSIAVAGETGTFTQTVDPQTYEVTGALVFEQATVTLPAAITLNVSMSETPTKAPQTRRYLLARFAGAGEKGWTLVRGANMPSAAQLAVDDDDVYLVLPPSGLIMFYR